MCGMVSDFPPSPGDLAGAKLPGQALRLGPDHPRSRLLLAALRLFAQQGYAKTSVRDLAEAASVNVAAVSYYFGDKAALYRAVFVEPIGADTNDLEQPCGPQGLPLRDALQHFFTGMLEPLKQGDLARLCIKLHFREMVEPTGLWADDSAFGVRPLHDALLALLTHHLGLAGPDADLERLAVCVAGLAVHLHVGLDVIDQIAPGLNATPESFDVWRDRLVEFSLAMIDCEQRRRAAAGAGVAA
jgi:AcrR family transcriptional regulator